MIPVEAVEAAAKVMLDHLYSDKTLEVDDEDRDMMRAVLEAAAPFMLIHVHHHDIEKHAASFNEGYETAMAQELADNPATAQDWLDAKLREARAQALEDAAQEFHDRLPDGTGNGRAYNSYRVAELLRARAAAERGQG